MPKPKLSVLVEVPYDTGWSDNRIWIARAGSYARRMSPDAATRKHLLSLKIREALRGRQFFRNRILVTLHVDKPDHGSDAHNCVKLVLDAVENGIGVDDRWFVLSGPTWGIRPSEPVIRVRVEQRDAWDACACSGCGAVLPADQFPPSTLHQGRCPSCRKADGRATRERARRRRLGPGPSLDAGPEPPWR